MRIKNSELQAVLTAVEEDLQKAFEAEKATLLKADGKPPDDEPASASEGPVSADTSTPASSPSSESAPASPAADAPGPEAAASAPAAPGMDGSAPMDPAAQQGDQLTLEALQAEYAQLPPEELDMHIQAALAAKEALMASAPGADGSAAPMASPAASAPAASPAPAMKAEIKSHDKASGGQDGSFPAIEKSEKAIASLETLVKSQEETIKKAQELIKSQAEDIDNLAKAMKTYMERPERKAVTGISYLKKAEVAPSAPEQKEFTPAEAKERLKEIIPTLSKAEREVVMDFYEGKVKVDKLTPILEKVK
jgi:hypothetical protein